VLGTVFVLALAQAAAANDVCAGRATLIVVQTKPHLLYLCEGGRTVTRMKVALGSGGLDKRRQGDAKVPLGGYSLAAPVASRQFHTFILIGYPTPAQRRAGFTGSAVGVHGPARGYAGALSTSVDWTLGCIAVGTDGEIDEIAAWVKARRVNRIEIQ